MLGYLGPKPGICTEPRGMHKVMKRDDGLKPILTAFRQDINIVVQRLMIEGRGRPRLIDESWLDPAPFDPKTEGVQTKFTTACKILWITIPEVGREAGMCDISPSLCSCPVCLGLPGPVVPPLGLIGGSCYPPKKLAHWATVFYYLVLCW